MMERRGKDPVGSTGSPTAAPQPPAALPFGLGNCYTSARCLVRPDRSSSKERS